MIKKTLNFTEMSRTLTYINSLKSAEKSKITILGTLDLIEGLKVRSRLY